VSPVFLSPDDVLAVHEREIRKFGGMTGLRDPGLFESAMAQPEARFGGEFLHEDVFTMAAAYLFHVVKNHPFVDGNKRTGLVAALVFLGLNGEPILPPSVRLYDATMAVARGELGKAGLAAIFRELGRD